MTSCHVWFAVNANKLLKKLNPDIFIALCELPWNTIAGLPDPGQMRLFTLNYGSGSRRALNSSVASCFCVTSNRCDFRHPRSSRFCKGASSSRLGSRRPDDSISVRRWGAHNPTMRFMGAEPVKSWNSLRACFYGHVSSIQKEKLFTPIVFLWAIEF